MHIEVFFSDTDSMAIATTDEMDKCVKNKYMHRWQKKKAKIFVLDESDPYDLRMPGKWKKEFSTNNGALVM